MRRRCECLDSNIILNNVTYSLSQHSTFFLSPFYALRIACIRILSNSPYLRVDHYS